MNSANTWSVYRQDDNGNRFLVQTGLTEAAATALARELESHGHKQLYWATNKPDKPTGTGRVP